MKDAPARMTGRRLQARRLKVWASNPHCARCGALTGYPAGFDLDHIASLDAGGEDVEANTQVLCNGPDGCHNAKTAIDMGYEPRSQFDPAGRVKW